MASAATHTLDHCVVHGGAGWTNGDYRQAADKPEQSDINNINYAAKAAVCAAELRGLCHLYTRFFSIYTQEFKAKPS